MNAHAANVSGVELRQWSEITQTFDVLWRHVGPDWNTILLKKLKTTDLLTCNPPVRAWTLHKLLATPQQGVWIPEPSIF